MLTIARLVLMAKDKARDSRESSIASGWLVEGDTVQQPETFEEPVQPGDPGSELDAEPDAAEPQLSAGALVLLGLIGGVYLLYTIVWFSWANYYSVMNSVVADGSGTLGGVLQQVVFWLTPLAPLLWFMSVLILCRDSKLGKKLLWLLVGAVALVPLPMFGGMF